MTVRILIGDVLAKLGQNPTPPEPQVLTPVDPRFVSPPVAGDWALSASTLTEGGTQVPILLVEGLVDNPTADAVIFAYRPYGVTPAADWTPVGQDDPTTTKREIGGAITPGTQYEVSVTYRRGNNFSDPLILDPVTAGDLTTPPTPNSVNGGVHVVKNTVVPSASSYVAANISGSGTTRVRVAEVVYTTSGSKLVVRYNALVDWRHEPSGSFTLFTEVRRQTVAGTGDIQILQESMGAPGDTADGITAKWPIDLEDTPSSGSYRYYVEMWSTVDNMTAQNTRSRFMSVTEQRTNT